MLLARLQTLVRQEGVPPPANAPHAGAGLPEGLVTRLVRARDERADAPRGLRSARDYLHVSSLVNLCARRQWLSATYPGRAAPRAVAAADRLLWAQGLACENHVVDALGESGGPLYGLWSCRCHATRQVGPRPRGLTCGACRTAVARHRQTTLFHDALRLVGNPDGMLLHGGRLSVLEVKSVTKEAFEALEAPRADHLLQAAAYDWMLANGARAGTGVLGAPASGEVVLLYVNRGYRRGPSPYKEYHVRWHETPHRATLERLLAELRTLRDRYLGSGDAPPRPCRGPRDRLAGDCPLAGLCFQLEPATAS